MAIILSLESATAVCSVALHKDGELMATDHIDIPQSHASQLAVLAHHVFEHANVHPEQLVAVAVSAGPGSYTGLRIGASLAKGLAFGLSIPIISVDSLLVLANQMVSVSRNDSLLCPMIDARRMEVYCQVVDHELNVIQATAPHIVGADSFANLLSTNRMIFFGDGAMKCESIIRHENATFVEGKKCRAQDMGTLAYKKLLLGEFEEVGSFEPRYGKEYLAKVGSRQWY